MIKSIILSSLNRRKFEVWVRDKRIDQHFSGKVAFFILYQLNHLGFFFQISIFLKIYIKILSPVLQSMIGQSLLELFCRFFFLYNSTRNFSSRERLFQIICNVRYQCRLFAKKKKKEENWNLLETQGKKWKQIPPKKYWEWIFFESCSQQWKDNQKHKLWERRNCTSQALISHLQGSSFILMILN